jgi:hypothetical protein
VFENRVLRRMFGPKRDEVTGEWRKLHNEELHGRKPVGTSGCIHHFALESVVCDLVGLNV